VNGTHEEQWMTRFEHDARLRSALDSFLIPSEAVEAIVYGAGGSAVIGTPAGILVYKRGIRAGIPFGYRLKAFEFESVVAVNVRDITEGTILAIHAPLKGGSCSVYWLDERDNAWKARNAVLAEPGDGRAPRSSRPRNSGTEAAHQPGPVHGAQVVRGLRRRGRGDVALLPRLRNFVRRAGPTLELAARHPRRGPPERAPLSALPRPYGTATAPPRRGFFSIEGDRRDPRGRQIWGTRRLF
jgi:hypothetical protein